MKIKITTLLLLIVLCSCDNPKEKEEKITTAENAEETPEAENESIAQLKKELTDKGYQIFDYVDEKSGDTVLMQQYYIAFLKRGTNRSQNKDEADSLQQLHLTHLGSMYEQGFADISGPFGDDGDIRGITIYNVPTQQMADSLANIDPMVQSGRLAIEIHPWWAAKGFPLR